MSVTLAYNDTVARVEIGSDQWDHVDTVLIQRSTNNISWTDVRSATELVPVSGTVSVNDYEFQPGVPNYYKLIPTLDALHTRGITGVSGVASTPDSAALSLTGDVWLTWFGRITDLDQAGRQCLVGKFSTLSQRSYMLAVSGSKLEMHWSTSGQGSAIAQNLGYQVRTSTVNIPDDAEDWIGLRALLDVSAVVTGVSGIGNSVTFEYSTDGQFWTALGAHEGVVTGWGATSVFDGTARLTAGNTDVISGGTEYALNGWTESIIVQAGVTGTQVASTHFDGLANLTTSFTDGTGNVWTVTGGLMTSAAHIHGYQLANITPNLTRIWLKSTTRPFLNVSFAAACATFGDEDLEMLVTDDAVTRPTRGTVFPIINRTLPVGITDLALGRTWAIRLRAFTAAAHQSLDYLFASGDVLFIQVPRSDCVETIEHGYILAFDPAYRRHHRYRNRVVWDADVQEVAAPAADIGYREATWATVLAQFGTWAAVMAACPTWADVLALLPDPSEVIVE